MKYKQDKSYEEKIGKTAELIKKSSYVVAFTGAGISTESGIPDFRSPGGLWQRFKIVTLQEFLFDRQARQQFWAMKKELIGELLHAKPNNAHIAISELEKMGLIKYLITQNVDGLHQLSGNKNVVELHGNNKEAQCLSCWKNYSIYDVYEMLKKEETDILCYECGGIIKPKVVFFGEPMPERELLLANELATKCDLMLVVGSSLQVEPAASIPRIAYKNGAKLIFINKTDTDWDFMAEINFYDSAGKVLKDILEKIKGAS